MDFVRRIREPLIAGVAERQFHLPPITQPRDRAAPLTDRLRADAELVGNRVHLRTLVCRPGPIAIDQQRGNA
jgi:hypothetical protein